MLALRIRHKFRNPYNAYMINKSLVLSKMSFCKELVEKLKITKLQTIKIAIRLPRLMSLETVEKIVDKLEEELKYS